MRNFKLKKKKKVRYTWLSPCFPGSSVGKESACNAGDLGSVPRSEDPLKKSTATQSTILAWEIPQTEEPGRLLPMGSQESDMTS